MTQEKIEQYRETLKVSSELEKYHGNISEWRAIIKCLQIFNHILSLPDETPKHDIHDMSDAD